jgi:hypothetical protein
MTQLLEGVAIGMVVDSDVSCPFDHDVPPDPPVGANAFIGDGGTLGSKMASGASTIMEAARRGPKPPAKVPNPNDVASHALHRDKKPVVISWQGNDGEGGSHAYPVTCAAHHLIPAQASLKRAKALHRFMVAKREDETLKGGVATGMVVSDLGYDVNGIENGIFLPGNYAVASAAKLWVREKSVLDMPWNLPDPEDDDEHAVPMLAKQCSPDEPHLTGLLHEVAPHNRKWQYVSQAMALAGAQFHDSHKDYSIFVIKVLQKIGTEYFIKARAVAMDSGCPDCKERNKKMLACPRPICCSSGSTACLLGWRASSREGLLRKKSIHLGGCWPNGWHRNRESNVERLSTCTTCWNVQEACAVSLPS